MENQETGEVIVLGRLPHMKYKATPDSPDFTWWSIFKLRLFWLITRPKARYYARKWAK